MAGTEIVEVLGLDHRQVEGEGALEGGGQHGQAIGVALAVADDDLLELEVDVFDAQSEGLEEAHAGAVEEREEEVELGRDGGEDSSHFVGG